MYTLKKNAGRERMGGNEKISIHEILINYEIYYFASNKANTCAVRFSW